MTVLSKTKQKEWVFYFRFWKKGENLDASVSSLHIHSQDSHHSFLLFSPTHIKHCYLLQLSCRNKAPTLGSSGHACVSQPVTARAVPTFLATNTTFFLLRVRYLTYRYMLSVLSHLTLCIRFIIIPFCNAKIKDQRLNTFPKVTHLISSKDGLNPSSAWPLRNSAFLDHPR